MQNLMQERWQWLARNERWLRSALTRRFQRSDAEDFAQTTLVRAASAREGKLTRSFLLRIARNAAIDDYRARRRLVSLEELQSAHTLAPSSDRIDLDRALSSLSASDHNLLRQIAAGLSYAELASEYRKSEDAIRQRVARARARLLRALGEKSDR